MKRFWLFKTEPATFSIDDLNKSGTSMWEGVRNYQARNFLRDEIKKNDEVLIYHSGARPPGVAGVAVVTREGYADYTAWDKKSEYFDNRSTKDNPVWYMVDVKFKNRLARFVSLDEIKSNEQLAGIMVSKKGMMLSVQPVSKEHFKIILTMGARNP